MIKILKHTSICSFFFMIIPFLTWIIDWKWNPKIDYEYFKILYWIIKTVSPPWGILTNIFLCCFILLQLNYNFKSAIRLFIILNIIIIIGQSIKILIKDHVKEYRPYINSINDYYVNEPLNKNNMFIEKKKLITNFNINNNIPIWLQEHWICKSNFSFPSGHTIFSSSWTLLIINILSPYRYFITTIIMIIWTSCIMIGQMIFGIHWPKDIIMGIIISWLLSLFGSLLIYKIFLIKN